MRASGTTVQYTRSLADARRDQQGGKGEGTIFFSMVDGFACVKAALSSWDKVWEFIFAPGGVCLKICSGRVIRVMRCEHVRGVWVIKS